ncbi:MAG: hypothetical protein R3B68_16855 [Phycisphaerales bacterium]
MPDAIPDRRVAITRPKEDVAIQLFDKVAKRPAGREQDVPGVQRPLITEVDWPTLYVDPEPFPSTVADQATNSSRLELVGRASNSSFVLNRCRVFSRGQVVQSRTKFAESLKI